MEKNKRTLNKNWIKKKPSDVQDKIINIKGII